jgi:hypothetical protein
VAFIVEEGTGRSDANSFVSLDFFRAYCDDRGYQTQAAWADDRTQFALVKATAYFNAIYDASFDGCPMVGSQSLCWPRNGATKRINSMGDLGCVPSGVVPVEIQQSVCELALLADTMDLAPTVFAEDLNVTLRKVGPIEIRYNGSAKPYNLYRMSVSLIRSYTWGNSPLNLRIIRS